MRKKCPTTIEKKRKNRTLLGNARVTPDEGMKALWFIGNRTISSLHEVGSNRLADSKNDLSSPAIGKIRKQNPGCIRNKYGTLCSLWSP
ncbi:MAG TPA: hypothetical protein VLR72_05185 [Clostridiaceae bacterium]|nr:hypothetical protein [Clostridiaceae bacterium]